MRFLGILVAFLAVSLNANANNFESFFEKASKNNNSLAEFNELKAKGEITKTSSDEDRIVVGKVQLSFEQALSECLKDKKCTAGRAMIQTPLPATPLRAEESNIKEVSGTDNKDINSILLARKAALLSYAAYDHVKVLLSYGSEGDKAANYSKYKELVLKFNKLFIDCQGCYDFFNESQGGSGALYTIKTKDSKTIFFRITNSQLLEKNKPSKVQIKYAIES